MQGMIQLELETKSGSVNYTLASYGEKNRLIWKDAELPDDLQIETDSNGDNLKIHKNERIVTKDKKIEQWFRKKYAFAIEEGFESAQEEEESLPYPYDPDKIRISTSNLSIDYIYKMIKNKEIDLHPEYQRYFVWTDITKKSRLIESILLRIPLPVFYIAQDKEELNTVIDGLQRLTVIENFIDNKFNLKGLEYLNECEGCYFNKVNSKKLEPKYIRRIEATQLTFNVIDPQTPEDVKFDIFRRLNEGGKPLNRQEIRNSMARLHVREFIRSLVECEEFQKATDHSISNVRMVDQEMALKLVAFYLQQNSRRLKEFVTYKGNMSVFLDKTLEYLNRFSGNDPIFSEILNAFKSAMKNAYYLFGEYTFRKNRTGNRRPAINTQLFLTFSVLLSPYRHEVVTYKAFIGKYPH